MPTRKRARSDRATVAAVDSIIQDFEHRLTVARAVRELVSDGVDVPDVTSVLRYETARVSGARSWALRPGSNAERIVLLLERASPDGLTEGAIVAELRAQGRLADSKNPVHSVHWTLYNLQRRSGALRRDHQGQWHIISSIPRRTSKGGD